jgi:signal transduction histidine kinase
VVIQYRDKGPGVPPEKLGKIFDRFERATSGFGITGLGLGLYICRQIVEAHGGTINADSLPGQGMGFTISLPRWEEVPEQVVSAS